jgi:hypothetical protein
LLPSYEAVHSKVKAETKKNGSEDETHARPVSPSLQLASLAQACDSGRAIMATTPTFDLQPDVEYSPRQGDERLVPAASLSAPPLDMGIPASSTNLPPAGDVLPPAATALGFDQLAC